MDGLKNKIKEILQKKEELTKDINSLSSFHEEAISFISYKENKKEVNELKDKVIEIIGTGYWAPALLITCAKKDLISNIKKVCSRISGNKQQWIYKLDKEIECLEKEIDHANVLENGRKLLNRIPNEEFEQFDTRERECLIGLIESGDVNESNLHGYGICL